MYFIYCREKNYKEIIIHPHSSANNGRAFLVDIVFIYDVELSAMYMEMSTDDYFKNYEMQQRENPVSLVISHHCFIPGQPSQKILLNIKTSPNLVNCIMFCRLQSNNRIPKKTIIGNAQSVIVKINNNGVYLEQKES